jgi:hypothetical protein
MNLRRLAAGQQPRRFRSKADVNLIASRHRVYEYTALERDKIKRKIRKPLKKTKAAGCTD